ncbi:glycosyltransferase family 4 protein [Kovacikia minuta CCNUW1]|uniref:glycosyltransferase family 4 protein n=1 Tax=Kovacikia minuta TaxID=2931930 RepID=UPI001CCB75BC|nr:glycosyltransferase family 4 protein [Kovacikia minuta]UBF27322.1 glycosyltransferase family 4 protein [Kovacikia minuta CCNUW1]
MKIAVIGSKGLPPKQGGIEHYCAEVYPRMVAQGHSVDLFARSSYLGLPWFSQTNYRGVRVISLPSPNLKGIDAFISSALGAIAARGNRYDIVHFHALGPSLFSWLPNVASSAKVVVTCQGLDWQRAKWGKLSSRLIFLGEKTAVRFADGMIVVSDALGSYFKQTYGRETVYIPNAPASYDESDPAFTYGTSLGLEKGRYIIFIGRLVPEKCPDLLIKAFQTLRPLGWKLVLAGGNSDTESYITELGNLSMSSSDILFAGELRGSRLAEIVRGAGLFVLPSNLEGLPLAMLEAMQEGVPVLASDIPPHRQLLGEDRGLLFQAANLDSLVKRLNWALHNSEAMMAMSEKAKEYVKLHYNWDRITDDNLRLYKALSGQSKGSVISDKVKASV